MNHESRYAPLCEQSRRLNRECAIVWGRLRPTSVLEYYSAQRCRVGVSFPGRRKSMEEKRTGCMVILNKRDPKVKGLLWGLSHTKLAGGCGRQRVVLSQKPPQRPFPAVTLFASHCCLRHTTSSLQFCLSFSTLWALTVAARPLLIFDHPPFALQCGCNSETV